MGGENRSSEIIESLLFPKVFQTFRMAMQPAKLTITFLALAIVCATGFIMDLTRPVVQNQAKRTELDVYMVSRERVDAFINENRESGTRKGVFLTLWDFTGQNFQDTLKYLFTPNFTEVGNHIWYYFKAAAWAFRYHPFYCTVFIVIMLAVVSVAGGSICRMSAMQFAQGEKPGLTEALRFGAGRFWSFFIAPLIPVGVIVVCGALIMLLGLITNIPWAGELILGLSMPLLLFAGSVIAFFAIGVLVAFNLMYPAVAYDGCDCFDVIGRSFSYVFNKPWRMGFYTVIAAIYGAICYIFARVFVFLLLWFTYLFLSTAIFADATGGNDDKLTLIWAQPTFGHLVDTVPLQGNLSEKCSAVLVRLSLWVVIGLLVSFIISFYFTANTIIYALMRNRVDGTALEEAYSYSHPQAVPIQPPPIEPGPETNAKTDSGPESAKESE